MEQTQGVCDCAPLGDLVIVSGVGAEGAELEVGTAASVAELSTVRHAAVVVDAGDGDVGADVVDAAVSVATSATAVASCATPDADAAREAETLVEPIEFTAGKLQVATGKIRGVHRIMTPGQRERVIDLLYKGYTLGKALEKIHIPRMRELMTRHEDPSYGVAIRTAVREAAVRVAEERLVEAADNGGITAIQYLLNNLAPNDWKPDFARGAQGRDEVLRRAGNVPMNIQIKQFVYHPPAQLRGAKREVVEIAASQAPEAATVNMEDAIDAVPNSIEDVIDVTPTVLDATNTHSLNAPNTPAAENT